MITIQKEVHVATELASFEQETEVDWLLDESTLLIRRGDNILVFTQDKKSVEGLTYHVTRIFPIRKRRKRHKRKRRYAR